MMAPLVVTATAVSHGTAGWALLAAMFVAGGLATAVVARHASRRRALQPQPIPVSG
jgi:hypothetical protein